MKNKKFNIGDIVETRFGFLGVVFFKRKPYIDVAYFDGKGVFSSGFLTHDKGDMRMSLRRPTKGQIEKVHRINYDDCMNWFNDETESQRLGRVEQLDEAILICKKEIEYVG